VVRIWTAQRRFITQLRNHPKVTEVRSGHVDGSAWAEFSVGANDWSPVHGVKRTVVLSDEQRRILSERGLGIGRRSLPKKGRIVPVSDGSESRAAGAPDSGLAPESVLATAAET
jgi:hypothetical protein